MSGTTSVGFGSSAIADGIYNTVSNDKTKLAEQLSSKGGTELSEVEMLQFQSSFASYKTKIETVATITKSMADLLQNITSKL